MNTPEYLTVSQAADRLDVSVSLIYKRIRAGAIPVSPLTGRAIRIPASALDPPTQPTTQPEPLPTWRGRVELRPGYRRLGR